MDAEMDEIGERHGSHETLIWLSRWHDKRTKTACCVRPRKRSRRIPDRGEMQPSAAQPIRTGKPLAGDTGKGLGLCSSAVGGFVVDRDRRCDRPTPSRD